MSFSPTVLIPSDKKILINSVDVTSYLSGYVIERPCHGIATANVVLSKDLDNIITLANGDILEIYSGDVGTVLVRKFYGIILSKQYDLSGYSISASDELWKAMGKTLTKLYDVTDPADPFGGDIRLLLIDLITKAGLTTTDSCIDATSVIIPQVLCDSVKIWEKINELSQVLYWDVHQDPVTRYIYATDPVNYPPYGTSLEVGTNVTESPNYNENIYQVINEVEVQGIRTFPLTKETFIGDGVKTTYTVTKYPIATYVKITDNTTSAVLAGATEGAATGTYDYLVNLNKGTITFTIAPIHTLTIEYTATELTSVTVDDITSKLMTKGVRKLVISLPDVANVADATQRANAILEESKEEFANFTLKTYNTPDITPYYTVSFYDPLKNKTFANLGIVTVKESWPQVTTEIVVGKSQLTMNNLMNTVEERVKKLERVRREGVLLRVNKLFENNMYFVMDDLEIQRAPVGTVRQFVLDNNTYGLLDLNSLGISYGDAKQFILGDAVWGVMGTDVLGQELPGTPQTIVKRRYKWTTTSEYASGTSDANIDTTNGDIRFM